ncbi:InlB B-repeat-containing protein [Metallosphaera javensis (ex Sakai et al. 2022)]|uniref:InlB B-repeat-containing protein n=1 Tax=Metallosphaera javensis (ex Sakai et al. 2022) TaxID=2775498 RepID=UPI00258E7F1D
MLLIPLLLAQATHAVTVHVYIYGGQADALLYVNGSLIYVNGNQTVNVPNSTLQVYVESPLQYRVFVNGVESDNLSLNPWTSDTINITVRPILYQLNVTVKGPGTLSLRFPNSTQVKVNESASLQVQAGTLITIVAIPKPGYSVGNWSNGFVGNEVWYLVYNDTNITVYFVKSPQTSRTVPAVSYSGLGLLAVLGGVYWFTRRR